LELGREEQGGPWPSWIFKIAAKKVVLLVSNGKKQISPLWDPPTPTKYLKKSISAPPLEKSFRHPWH